MQLPDFRLERYFARYEFSAPYLLCCSDCESLTVNELLALGGEQAREEFGRFGLGYTESLGNPALRAEIASLYTSLRAEQVLVTSGAEEAIYLFMRAVLQPGDHVIVQFPCYQSLEAVAASAGCPITRWTMLEHEGRWELDLEQLRQAIRPNTRLLVINSPHNPTGHLLSQTELETILGIAREHGMLVFSDEVYRLLEFDPTERPAAACDLYENAVSLGVMSKSFGLAGLRIGWIATANEEVYRAMAAYKDYTSICSSGPSEFLAALALRHRDAVVSRNLAIIQANLTLLDAFFKRQNGIFAWTRPKAGPIAFPSLRAGGGSAEFCDRLVREAGVLLLPSVCYDSGDASFRIGFGRRNLPEALERLEAWLVLAMDHG